MSLLKVINLSSGYQDSIILCDISFSVSEGEFIGIIGPNGAGKTTLLKTLTHIIKPKHGIVLFDEKNILGKNQGNKFCTSNEQADELSWDRFTNYL